MPDIATRLGTTTTGQLLVRSGLEIEGILRSLVESGSPVTAKLPDSMFISRLLAFDTAQESLMVAYCDHKPANSAVLALRSVVLTCNYRDAQFAFTCTGPRQGAHAGQPAIRMALPAIMLVLQHGHRWIRAKMPREVDVRCELRMGTISFGAKLVDMSSEGKAFLLGDPAIPLCAGTRLQGARIREGQHEPLVVDLEIDQVIQAVLPDGKRATRIGCRIAAEREKIDRLARLFIIDLE
jgi:c-di-GMP-binding flagellar brake protein YcgR